LPGLQAPPVPKSHSSPSCAQDPSISASNLGTRAVALGAIARGIELARESAFTSLLEHISEPGSSA